jgi:hypothetical protein
MMMMMVFISPARPVLVVTVTETTFSVNRYSVVTSDGTTVTRR